MKKGDKKTFKNYKEMLDWLSNRKTKDGEFSLRCSLKDDSITLVKMIK